MDGTGSACFADLTHALTTGMPVYPGDPEVEIDEVLTLPADGCSVRSLHLGSHSGTHVDAPAHVIAGGRTIDQVAPEELMGDAAVLHLPDLTTRQRIDGEMLGEALRSGPENLPSIILLATGWDRFWGADDYLRHPVLTEDAASFLVRGGVRVLGMDMASPDGSDSADSLATHEVLLGADRLIIENLRGLTDLPRHVEFTALPLRIAGGDGGPVRAVAKY
ncbi:MAG: cyclase family protein [Corynebacterium sp.]|nr:cyclase family protein [Corynebacterium sp.]MDN5722909.1 cyclase family protein [Corynebacterium sp.]MDN6281563.1 cyclase family protein [Corynebacterium sp.]MDN6305144.1 cyclase family protein [Corynebacterium sp.]MDN6367377.1 cyclase family protein [Corynebacterium sp.]MDN6374888.1 cyclase family protein [Corynebacterium sp.]